MTYSIDRLGHLGDGIANTTEGPIFAPLTLPGEVIAGTPLDGRIAQPKIVTPSADRVAAPCVHFRACGGCALQHASDPFVTGWKADVVRQALAAHDIAATIDAVHISPARSRRRATLAGRRTKSGAMIGFHARASDQIVAISDCHILRPEIMAMIPLLERITQAGASRKATLDLAVTLSLTGPDIAVTGGKPMDAALFQTLAELARQGDLARLTWEGEPVAARRAPLQRMGRAQVSPPPGAFLQATAEGEAALTRFVDSATQGAARIADLFAGCGTFALPLAARAEVHAVEGAPAQLAALDAGWRAAPGLHRVTHEARDLFARPLMPDELARFDALVIDPPRAGAEAQCAQIAAAGVPVLAYVSCNPVTFGRDAARLIGAGYRLDRLEVIDQFRWSPHVELAARFMR